jgi:hypothetical protein
MTTREELHALVWSQPMRTLAKSRGISDVALAKQCRKAGVPVPPRGWWARKEAGKPVRGHDKSSSQVSGISEQTVNIDSAVTPQAQINRLASLSRIERLRTDPGALSGN